MPTYGKKLLDNNGNTILPKTRSNLVYHTNNQLVSTVLDNLSTNISAISTSIANITDGTTTVGRSAVANAVRDQNVSGRNYGLYQTNGDTSGIAIWDLNLNKQRVFNNAIADQNGNVINTTYLNRGGGNMTGALTCNANAYTACHNMVAYNKGGWTAQTVNYFWGQYA